MVVAVSSLSPPFFFFKSVETAQCVSVCVLVGGMGKEGIFVRVNKSEGGGGIKTPGAVFKET